MLQKNIIFPPRKRQFCDARELYLDRHIARVHVSFAFMIFPSHVSCQNVYKYSDEGSVPTSYENISGPGLLLGRSHAAGASRSGGGAAGTVAGLGRLLPVRAVPVPVYRFTFNGIPVLTVYR